jgi:hypothetical protein
MLHATQHFTTARKGRPCRHHESKEIAMKKLLKVRGASMVEYALLLFAVLIVAAAAIKLLGPRVVAAGNQGAAAI